VIREARVWLLELGGSEGGGDGGQETGERKGSDWIHGDPRTRLQLGRGERLK
jgi:hypothetical protein